MTDRVHVGGATLKETRPPSASVTDAAPALQTLGDRVVRPLLLHQRVGHGDPVAVGRREQTVAREALRWSLQDPADPPLAVGGVRSRDHLLRHDERVGGGRQEGQRRGGPALQHVRGECVERPRGAHVIAAVGVRVHAQDQAPRRAPPVPATPVSPGACDSRSTPGEPSAASGMRTVPAPSRASLPMCSQTAGRGRSIAITSAPHEHRGPSGPIAAPAPTSITSRSGSDSHSGCSATRRTASANDGSITPASVQRSSWRTSALPSSWRPR